MRIAAGLETGSEHPLVQAIVAAATARGLQLETVTDFEAIAGQSASGNWQG